MIYLLIIYALILIGITYSTLRMKQDAKSYVIGKKKLGVWEIATSSTAGVLDITGIFVMFGAISLFGLAGVGLWVAYIFSTICIAILAPYFYDTVSKENIWTFSDFFKERFGIYTEKAFAIISTIFMFSLVAGLYSINLILFERFFEIGTFWATVISFAITLTYTLAGGFRALVKTDILQYTIMFLFLIIAVIFFPETEGVVRTFDFSSWFGGAFLMLAPVIFFQNIIKPAAWQPIIGAKNKNSVQKGMWLAVLLNMLIVVPIVWIAFAYTKALPDSDAMNILLDALSVSLPDFAAPFVFVGLLAALMSSLDTALFFIGSNISHNLVPKKWLGKIKKTNLIKILVIVASLITVLLAILIPNFITFTLSMIPLMGVVAIPFLIGIFIEAKHLDKEVVASLIAGTAAFTYLFMSPPENYIWNIIPILTSGILFTLFSVLKRKNKA